MCKKNMDEISELLAKAIWLLQECGYSEKAKWFEAKLAVLENRGISEVRSTLAEIYEILSGIGSFSDLSLVPREGSTLSQAEARDIQWGLVEKLGEKIAFQVSNT